ncbi:PRMT5 family protein [Megaselia abdita]
MTYTCLISSFPGDIKQTIEFARINKFSAISVNSINYGFRDRELLKLPLKNDHVPFSRSDLILEANDWSRRVIMMLSDPYGIDFKDGKVRQAKEALLCQELDHANFLQGSGYVMIRLNYGNKLANLARILAAKVKCLALINLKLSNEEDTWSWWNQLRTCANFSGKFKVVLEITSGAVNEEALKKWLGEPIEGLEIPTSLFIRNKNNYPVLPKNIQQVLGRFLEKRNINFFVSAPFDENLHFYSEYLESVKVKLSKYQDNVFKSVADALQIPLQPLYDNLDTYTYDVFEKDPIKYMKYQEAITAALKDMEGDSEKIIMVLGAGRGPLVRAVLNGACKSQKTVKILVIEKNACAINTLYGHMSETWLSETDKNPVIEVINKDMRDYNPPVKADMIVSELLGSFGDNELSPECLDCATRLLKDTGISIPYRSTSYVNPMMSTKLLEAVRNLPARGNQPEPFSYTKKAQTMYVVFLNNVYHIDSPKALFKFEHPNRENPVNNNRFGEVSFKAKTDCVLTGFAGYFDADLYKDIKISTHPLEHTAGMSSWFPVFIPLIQPQFVKEGEDISGSFWRNVGSHAVWYEWMTTSPQHSLMHNTEGHCSKIYSV